MKLTGRWRKSPRSLPEEEDNNAYDGNECSQDLFREHFFFENAHRKGDNQYWREGSQGRDNARGGVLQRSQGQSNPDKGAKNCADGNAAQCFSVLKGSPDFRPFLPEGD